MKRLLISTTAIAVAFSGMTPAPLFAQDTAAEECVEGQPCPDDKAARKAARQAEREAEKAAEKEAAKAARQAEREAARAAEEAAAAEAAAAEAAAAEKAAAEQAAAEQAAADAAAADAAAAEQAAADAAAAEAAAAEQAAAEAAAAKANEEPAPLPAEVPATDVPATEATATEAPADAPVAATEADPAATDDEAAKAARKAERKARKAAEAAAAEPPPEAAEALEGILTTTDPAAPVAAAAAAASATGSGSGTSADGSASQNPTVVGTTETTLTEADTRSSDEEFTTAEERKAKRDRKDRKDDKDRKDRKDRDEPVVVEEKDRLSDFEKFGLIALGALAVGAILKNGDRVVENTGDRVVVARSDGTYQVLKDDDTLIRQPGSTVRTETFNDGSTRTIVTREDGTQVVTIRDAAGRVLRRSSYDAQGRELVLIDDLAPVQPIDVTRLPRAPEVTLSSAQDPAALEAALSAVRNRETGGFSLGQVRDLREVRALAPRIEVRPITFATGSAAIDPSEAEKLAELGGLVARMVRERPNEMFLIEGHTDAVGSAASNLALSDRRAESVALALTEYFDVPPENLVVQGYGEGDLLVPVDSAEPRNRRVAVRVITPLLAAAR